LRETTRLGTNPGEDADGLCTNPVGKTRRNFLNNRRTGRAPTCRQAYKLLKNMKKVVFTGFSTENRQALTLVVFI